MLDMDSYQNNTPIYYQNIYSIGVLFWYETRSYFSWISKLTISRFPPNTPSSTSPELYFRIRECKTWV